MSGGGEKRGYDPARDPNVVKKMARLMLEGAVMLAETCPLDGLPLFRLRNGDIVCPVHGRIMLVHSEDEAEEARLDNTIWRVESYAARRVEKLLEEGDPKEILEWLRVIEAAEKIRGMRREHRTRQYGQAPREGGSRAGKGGERR